MRHLLIWSASLCFLININQINGGKEIHLKINPGSLDGVKALIGPKVQVNLEPKPQGLCIKCAEVGSLAKNDLTSLGAQHIEEQLLKAKLEAERNAEARVLTKLHNKLTKRLNGRNLLLLVESKNQGKLNTGIDIGTALAEKQNHLIQSQGQSHDGQNQFQLANLQGGSKVSVQVQEQIDNQQKQLNVNHQLVGGKVDIQIQNQSPGTQNQFQLVNEDGASSFQKQEQNSNGQSQSQVVKQAVGAKVVVVVPKKPSGTLCNPCSEGKPETDIIADQTPDKSVDIVLHPPQHIFETGYNFNHDLNFQANYEAQLRALLEAQLQAQYKAKLRAQLEAQLQFQLHAQYQALLRAKLAAQLQAQMQARLQARLVAQHEALLQARAQAQNRLQLLAHFQQQLEGHQFRMQQQYGHGQRQIRAKFEALRRAQLQAQLQARLQARQQAQLLAQLEAQQTASAKAQMEAQQQIKLQYELQLRLKAEHQAKLQALYQQQLAKNLIFQTQRQSGQEQSQMQFQDHEAKLKALLDPLYNAQYQSQLAQLKKQLETQYIAKVSQQPLLRQPFFQGTIENSQDQNRMIAYGSTEAQKQSLKLEGDAKSIMTQNQLKNGNGVNLGSIGSVNLVGDVHIHTDKRGKPLANDKGLYDVIDGVRYGVINLRSPNGKRTIESFVGSPDSSTTVSPSTPKPEG